MEILGAGTTAAFAALLAPVATLVSFTCAGFSILLAIIAPLLSVQISADMETMPQNSPIRRDYRPKSGILPPIRRSCPRIAASVADYRCYGTP